MFLAEQDQASGFLWGSLELKIWRVFCTTISSLGDSDGLQAPGQACNLCCQLPVCTHLCPAVC